MESTFAQPNKKQILHQNLQLVLTALSIISTTALIIHLFKKN